MPRILLAFLLAALTGLAGCQTAPKEEEGNLFDRLQGKKREADEERDQARREREAARDPRGDVLPYYEQAQAQAGGPSAAIRVTWEALARERELYEQSSHRRPQGAVETGMVITLLSESHPEAQRARFPRSDEERERYANTAIASDADLIALVRGLEGRGFNRLARPTDAQRGQWSMAAARGRVTIEDGTQSLTLLSMRGQGQNAATKDIPALYSEAKRAIVLLRNRTATLNVTHVERGTPLLPSGR